MSITAIFTALAESLGIAKKYQEDKNTLEMKLAKEAQRHADEVARITEEVRQRDVEKTREALGE